MPEQVGLDQGVGHRGTTHLDEQALGAHRIVVDGVGDEFLAGARFAANQHTGIRRRHLRDLLVNLPHAAAVADDVREIVALPKLLSKMRILIPQAIFLPFDQVRDVDRLSDHGRDHLQEMQFAVVIAAVALEGQIHPQRPHRLAIDDDGHTDERSALLVQILAPAGATEKPRLVVDDRLAGPGHPAGDAFQQPKTRLLAPRRQAVRRGDRQFLRLALGQGHDAREHGVVTFEQRQYAAQSTFQAQGAGQSLAYRHKRCELCLVGNGGGQAPQSGFARRRPGERQPAPGNGEGFFRRAIAASCMPEPEICGHHAPQSAPIRPPEGPGRSTACSSLLTKPRHCRT